MASNGAPMNGDAHHVEQKGHHELLGQFKKDETKGATVHKFDPDASPQEKAAAAGKARDQLQPTAASQEGNSGGGKAIDIDTGHSGVIPTITIEDADKATQEELDKTAGQPAAAAPQNVPGSFPNQQAPTIPDWYKVGWRALSNIDAAPLQEGEEKDKHVLQMFLTEQYYGAWYHNAAIIVFAVFASHFLTRFNFGWGWLFIILAVCNTYYTTSMTRVRRNARDDIQRELVKTRLASEHESADWINNFLDRFWLIYEPVLSATVVSSVDQILSTSCPPFLDSLRLSTFTLGTKAPRIEKVRTFPNTEDDVVMMDWGISFAPNDVSDMTPRQAAGKVNPKIVLSVRVGKGVASAAMPILIEDISFSGLMRIRMKLMTNFPHVQIVDLSFLEKPVFDYVLKPVGGDTFGFDVGHMPGLSAFIRDQVHANLGPMMYDPNKFTLNLEQLLSGTPLDAAIGVLQVTVEAARGLKGSKMGGGTPDPFVSLSINNRSELARTKYKHNTYNPTWMETKFILINSLQESLVLDVFDYNSKRSNTTLGAATFDMQKLQEDAKIDGIELPILKDGKDKGSVRFNLSFFPVLKPEHVDGTDVLPETKTGIVRLTIHQAKDLDHTKSLSGELNPFAKVYLGNSTTATHSTALIKHTNNPVWESATEFLCADKTSSIITIKVTDDRDFLKDPVVGHMSVQLGSLLEAETSAGRDWWPLSGCKSGKLRITTEWKPLQMAGALQGADQYVPPIGVVRLWLKNATDVKNVEAALGGKSDPYVRVQVNNITLGRTEVINNNLDPVWDQIIYVPVHSLRESLQLEVMDYQHLTKDRSLGSVELNVGELARPSADGSDYKHESTGKKEASDPIKLDGSHSNQYKGQLHYVAEFVPALALKGVEFAKDQNEIQRAAQNGGEEGDYPSSPSTTSFSSRDGEEVRHVTVSGPMTEEGFTQPQRSSTLDTTKTDKSGKSDKSDKTDKTNDTASIIGSDDGQEPEGVELSKEELLKHQSGVIVFNVVSGQLHKKARVEVLLDDGYWPCFSTPKARSTRVEIQHVGEGFIKELDFGQIWLRLNENDEGEKDDIIAEWKGEAKPFLEATLDRRTTFTLKNEEGNHTSTIELEARYVPVPVTLEARESINNQGILRVDLLEGKDLRAADRGGKSDPFAVFSLNGQRVFKSQTKKKTLTPDWSEDFTVNVPSRVAADFTVEVLDWNQIEQAKSLGTGRINLADLEPFQGTPQVISLADKHGQKGEIHVRLLFQPSIIAKSRKNTSTFSAAGRAMTQIGSIPVGAGKGVVHGIGGIFSRDFAKNNHSGKLSDKNDDPPAPPAPSGQASQPVGGSTLGAGGAVLSSASGTPANGNGAANGPPQQPGTLRVTVLDAKDLSTDDVKPYAIVRVGDKEHKTKHSQKTTTPEWNESFVFDAGASTPKVEVHVFDHKTLGKDKLLGQGEIDIWRHIQPGSVNSREVFAELRDHGHMRVRLEFDADPYSAMRNNSVPSIERTLSNQGTPSRFSMHRKRTTGGSDD
ncbi:tricalbin [Coniophora puteana RWD-64-598 SS2]|uniref:Tricalbin n=1 Tax=Coniophora puteana (strain RWD-64-598) TaxID=741705 RepID=A0A5M3N514_CONPW|nr:tricalbin [Coniophora puteana RWD-64-598 SS2]EIW86483.1 tricalbin [Coniophora puteana RWD-64-598 SS2]